MGNKIYLKMYFNNIMSRSLGFCSWQTHYESDKADPTHFFVIKTSQIWLWLLSVSLFDQCNGEVRVATLKIGPHIPRGCWSNDEVRNTVGLWMEMRSGVKELTRNPSVQQAFIGPLLFAMCCVRCWRNNVKLT